MATNDEYDVIDWISWVLGLAFALFFALILTSLTRPLPFHRAAIWSLCVYWAAIFIHMILLVSFLVIPERKKIMHLISKRYDLIDSKIVFYRIRGFVIFIFALLLFTIAFLWFAIQDMNTYFPSGLFGLFGVSLVFVPSGLKISELFFISSDLKEKKQQLSSAYWASYVPFITKVRVNIVAKILKLTGLIGVITSLSNFLVRPFARRVVSEKIQEAIKESAALYLFESFVLTFFLCAGWLVGKFFGIALL